MKEIIHLSDLHIGHNGCKEKFDKLANIILLNCIPAENYVIVITGDLIDDAKKTDYSNVITILDKLEKAGFEVLVVPGNHDYGRGWIADKEKVKEFKEAFEDKQTFIQLQHTTEKLYPTFKIITGIAFIGLDSMAKEIRFFSGKLGAEGELGDEQLKRLDEMLNSKEVVDCAKRVVYLHHHPFDTKYELPTLYLKDSDELKKIIAGKVDALLFGHKHSGKEHNETWNIPFCYDAGSSTAKGGKQGPIRIINLLTKTVNTLKINF